MYGIKMNKKTPHSQDDVQLDQLTIDSFNAAHFDIDISIDIFASLNFNLANIFSSKQKKCKICFKLLLAKWKRSMGKNESKPSKIYSVSHISTVIDDSLRHSIDRFLL